MMLQCCNVGKLCTWETFSASSIKVSFNRERYSSKKTNKSERPQIVRKRCPEEEVFSVPNPYFVTGEVSHKIFQQENVKKKQIKCITYVRKAGRIILYS